MAYQHPAPTHRTIVGSVPAVPFLSLGTVEALLAIPASSPDHDRVCLGILAAATKKKETAAKKSFDSMSPADLLAQEDPAVEERRDQLVLELLLDAYKAAKEEVSGSTAAKIAAYLHVHQQFAAELRAAAKAAAMQAGEGGSGSNNNATPLFSVSGKEAGSRLFDDLMSRHVVGLAEEHAAVVVLAKNNNGVIPGEDETATTAASADHHPHHDAAGPGAGGGMEIAPQGSLESLGGKSSMASGAGGGKLGGGGGIAGQQSQASIGNEGSLTGGGGGGGGGGGSLLNAHPGVGGAGADGASSSAANGLASKLSLKEAEALTRCVVVVAAVGAAADA